MSNININVIVTNPNDVHRILKDFGTSTIDRIENKKDHLVEKTPVNRRSEYLIQDNDRKTVSQSQKTITLEQFIAERNRLVMKLDKNSKKRLLETTYPPQFQSHDQSTMSYPYHPSIQFYRPNYDMMPNAGVPTPYNYQYSQVATVHHQNDVNVNTNANCTNTGHSTNSTAGNTTQPSQDKQSRQLELQLPDDSRSPRKKKQKQQQQYQQQQRPEVSSPELFRGLIDEIGDIDEV
jgi:hypothetical protein